MWWSDYWAMPWMAFAPMSSFLRHLHGHDVLHDARRHEAPLSWRTCH